MANEIRKVEYNLLLAVEKVLDLNLEDADNPVIQMAIDGLSGIMRAGTTIPATEAWMGLSNQLTAGELVLDLTALTWPGLANVTFNTLRIQAALLYAATGNTEEIEILPGATNSYNLFGPSHVMELEPGEAILLLSPSKRNVVSSTVKNIRFTSGDADAIFSALLVGG